MSATVLFSDVHLKSGPGARPVRDQFVRFLHSLRALRCERVVCLGDLFDFWFEYRHVCFSDYYAVLRAFSDLRDDGVALHLVCGNHDFWAGRFLRDEIGFQIHPDSVEMDLDGRRALLYHGDGVNPADRAYRAYRRIARNPFVVGMFRLLHPDWAMALASAVSHGSRSLTRVGDPAEGPEARALREHARALLEAGRADLVACGHSHAAALEWFPLPGGGEGLYLNPGDWMRRKTYVFCAGGNVEMRTWED